MLRNPKIVVALERFAGTWFVFATALVGLGFADSVSVVAREGVKVSAVWFVPGSLLLLLPAYLLLAAAGAGLVTCLLLPVSRDQFSRTVDVVSREWLGPLLVALALFAMLSYKTTLAAANGFKNRELASLLVVVMSLAWAAGALMLTPLLRYFFSRVTSLLPNRALGVAVHLVVGLAAAGAAAAWLGADNSEGFKQLGPGVFAGPLGACAFLAGGWFTVSKLKLPPLAAAIGLGVSLLCGIAGSPFVEGRSPALVASLSQHGVWSGKVMKLAYKLTDFDGDGYSSFLAGGDCGAFDEDVHPGAREIPGDGLDNNCMGGDAMPVDAPERPEWYNLPRKWPDLNLVVITVEAVRADHVSFLGYEKDTTPNLSKLAEKSTVFERFYATSTFTRLCLPSLLTSHYPSQIAWARARKKRLSIDESNPYLPSILQDSGFATAAVMAGFSLFTHVEKWGFDRGFDSYDSRIKVKYRGGTITGFYADKQVDKAIKFVKANRKGRFFLWIHLLEPHYKYQKYPKSPKFGKGELGKYDSEIWGVDKEVGRLLKYLKKSRLMKKTVVYFSGDHGEEFKEHGKRFHGSNLYEPQVRVPVLMWVPGVEGGVVSEPCSFRDVTPTLLNLLNVKNDFDRLRGQNLTPLFFDDEVDTAPIILELWKAPGFGDYQAAVVDWPYKLVYQEKGSNFELFDLSESAAEETDVSEDQPDVFEALKQFMFDYQDSVVRDFVD